ncbi:MAG: (2Fe-2S) ferredoxin domain-containing protein [bacterium]|nr:(2Fe-2S) ferredoxin domain-containing protein [bacterium]
MSRYIYHVFVCENRRPEDDPKGCCASKGGADILQLLRDKVKAAGLNSKIRINSSGCLANCARGASVVVYPDAVWYSFVNAEDCDEIFERHLLAGKPVTRLLDPMFHADRTKAGGTM